MGLLKSKLFIFSFIIGLIALIIANCPFCSKFIHSNLLILQSHLGKRIIPLPEYTVEELRTFDGKNNTLSRIYLAIKGEVFDVTNSQYYQPKGAYKVLASKDISVGIVKGGFNETFYDYEKYHWKRSLDEKEMKDMEDWH